MGNIRKRTILCAIVLITGTYVSACTENKAAAPPPPGIPVVVTKVLEKAMPVQVTSVGNVESIATVAIKAQVTGELLQVHFQEGDFVKKGQLLFTIDPRPFEAQIRQVQGNIARDTAAMHQAEANLARDMAQAQFAKTQTQRYSTLTQRGLISTDTSEQVKSQAAALDESVRADRAAIESAQAALKGSEGALETAKLQLSYATIYSPISGRTGAVLLKAGNLIKAADAPIVVINQVDPIYVNFTVPQQYWADVNKHMTAGDLHVVATAPQDRTPKEGKVIFVDNAVDASTGTLHIRASFDNADNRFLSGMFVNVILKLSEQPNAKVIPTQAITDGQNGTFVYVAKSDNTVEVRPIVTTRNFEGEAVIDKGLETNESVVIDGQSRLANGAKVQIK